MMMMMLVKGESLFNKRIPEQVKYSVSQVKTLWICFKGGMEMRTWWKNSHRRDIIMFCLTYIPLGEMCRVDAHALAASPALRCSPQPGGGGDTGVHLQMHSDSSLAVLADSCKSLSAVSNPGTPTAPGGRPGQLLLCPRDTA